MISLFGTGDFVRVDILNPDLYEIGRVGLLMGFVINDGKIQGLVSGQDGLGQAQAWPRQL